MSTLCERCPRPIRESCFHPGNPNERCYEEDKTGWERWLRKTSGPSTPRPGAIIRNILRRFLPGIAPKYEEGYPPSPPTHWYIGPKGYLGIVANNKPMADRVLRETVTDPREWKFDKTEEQEYFQRVPR